MSALLIEDDLLMSAARKTRRVNFEAPVELHSKLKHAEYDDNLKISDRMRALLTLWSEDPELAARVRQKAGQLAKERDLAKQREREEQDRT